jgi:hypothetical protein
VTPADICPACSSPRIPGITSCVNCGESLGAPSDRLVRRDWTLPADWQARAVMAQAFTRGMTEARALEYAGDIDGAIAIYEAMVTGGIRFTPPYQRLAILYGKAKRGPDEERVVRAALAHLSAGPGSWFVVRLAKILARAKR